MKLSVQSICCNLEVTALALTVMALSRASLVSAAIISNELKTPQETIDSIMDNPEYDYADDSVSESDNAVDKEVLRYVFTQKMGLKEPPPPAPSGLRVPTPILMEVEENNKYPRFHSLGDDYEDNNLQALTERIIILGKYVSNCQRGDVKGCYHFEIDNSDINPKEMKSATLSLFKPQESSSKHFVEHTIEMQEVSHRRHSKRGSKSSVRVSSPVYEEWMKVNITDNIQQRLQKRHRRYTLEVKCTTCDDSFLSHTDDDRRPYIEISFRSYNSRRRRSSDQHKDHFCDATTDKGCCVERANFSLSAVLDFVVHPQQVAMNRCKGSCQRKHGPDVIRTTQAALMHALGEPLCCHPKRLSSISVLMTTEDDGKFKEVILVDTVIDKCHCG